MEFIKKHSLLSHKIIAARRTEQWSIPIIAVREALINAFAHSDYSQRGAPIRLSIFDDRLEIENPGILPFGVTIEDIKEGISKIRNKVIVRVLHELGYVERWGMGITRIIESCKEIGLPLPDFKEISTRFRVTIYTQVTNKPLFDEIDDKILMCLKGSSGLSTHELSKAIGISSRATRERLKKLTDLNYIYEISTSPYDPNKKYRERNSV